MSSKYGKISVALATYNGEKYIEKQLDSIRNQTIKPDEVVIVDDKSSDRTVALINEFIAVNNLVNWKLFVNEKMLVTGRIFTMR